MKNILLTSFARNARGETKERPCFCNGGGVGKQPIQAAIERKEPLLDEKTDIRPETKKTKVPAMLFQQPVDITRVNGGGFF